MFYINQTGNGNPPPNKPKRSQVPVEQDPIDVPPTEQPK
jgi:hypothetical protein